MHEYKNSGEKESYVQGYKYFRSICESMKEYPFDEAARLEAERWTRAGGDAQMAARRRRGAAEIPPTLYERP